VQELVTTAFIWSGKQVFSQHFKSTSESNIPDMSIYEQVIKRLHFRDEVVACVGTMPWAGGKYSIWPEVSLHTVRTLMSFSYSTV